MQKFNWLLSTLTIILNFGNLMVKGNLENILQCDTSSMTGIGDILPKIYQLYDNDYSSISVLSDVEGILNTLKTNENYLGQNKTVQISFGNLEPIDLIEKKESIIAIIPTDELTAIKMLNTIGDLELRNKSKTKYHVIWPTTCTETNCLESKILNASFETLAPISSETFIVHCGPSLNMTDSSWSLYNIYSIGKENLTRLDLIQWNDLHATYVNRGNFTNATLTFGVPENVLTEEVTYTLEEPNNETVVLTGGLNGHVGLYLRDSLNFTMENKLRSGSFRKKASTELSDMARDLLETKIDLALVKSTLVPSRQESFSFLIPTFFEGAQAYFRQPPASSIRNIFIEPFTKGVWGTLIGVWCLVALSTAIAARIKSGYEQLLDEDKEISKDSILWAIALTCQQGWHLDPQSISIKMIFFCGSLMGLIVYVAYSAALVSSLSTVVIPIKRMGDLLQNNFDFAFQPESETMQLILTAEQIGDGEYGAVEASQLRRRERRIHSKDEGVKLMMQTKAAYLSFSDNFYTSAKNKWNETDRSLCEKVSFVKFSKVPFRSGMLVSKNSYYKEYFNHRLVCLYENGIMRRLQRNYLMSFRGECDKQRRKKGQGLGVRDLFTAYVVILSGYALSLTIFVIELLYFKHTQMVTTQQTDH